MRRKGKDTEKGVESFPILEYKALLIGQERAKEEALTRLLSPMGIKLDRTKGEKEALRRIEDELYSLVYLDLGHSPKGHLGLLSHALKRRPELTILVIAKERDQRVAMALKKGAFAFLKWPLIAPEFEIWTQRALERFRLSLENARLREENLRDDLTSVYNRRYLERFLEEELERCRRYKHPFSILFLDLDHLRFVNDAFGHLAGSQVLIEVAEVIQRQLRKVDRVFRFGGDEFVAALPETTVKGAYEVANRLCRAVKEYPFRVGEGNEVYITASIGIASYPEDGESGEELLKRADEAMYRVKETTRDGVSVRSA